MFDFRSCFFPEVTEITKATEKPFTDDELSVAWVISRGQYVNLKIAITIYELMKTTELTWNGGMNAMKCHHDMGWEQKIFPKNV